MAGISKSEKRKGSGVIGVVVGLSVAVVVPGVVVVVVDAVDAVVGGNLLRLPKAGAMSFGLFLREAEKLAFFAGLKNKQGSIITHIIFSDTERLSRLKSQNRIEQGSSVAS